MKKAIWMAMAVVLAASNLTFAQANPAVNDTLMKYEHEMLEQFQKKDWAGFKKRIMAGAWTIDENGPMPVEELVKQAGDPKANLMWTYKVSDMKVVDLEANTKAVVYKIDQKGSMMGQPFPPTVYSTTIWANHGGNWMAVFHQESKAAPPMPPAKK